ncbi:DNA-binding protein [candidate division KSB1 bacterium]|nr:MAG: DNA-binding protein [candidate division KSB1 bacterium]
MKRFLSTVAILAVIGLIFSSVVFAQGGRQNRGKDYPRYEDGKSSRLYNPATVETIRGEVTDVKTMTGKNNRNFGVHLLVNTGQETIPVHLGPSWYLEDQSVRFQNGDRVEITGSRITYEGKPALIADEVLKDGKTLDLRDASGRPQWAGKRGR